MNPYRITIGPLLRRCRNNLVPIVPVRPHRINANDSTCRREAAWMEVTLVRPYSVQIAIQRAADTLSAFEGSYTYYPQKGARRGFNMEGL